MNPLPFADQVVIMETVLVVEDEVVIRSSISEYLRRCAYRVLEAGDAEEALVILRNPSVKVDVLFTNIEMPGSVNGFELARRARELRPEIQVILTGTLERAADAAAGLCEDSPLPKPYEPQVVVDRKLRVRVRTSRDPCGASGPRERARWHSEPHSLSRFGQVTECQAAGLSRIVVPQPLQCRTPSDRPKWTSKAWSFRSSAHRRGPRRIGIAGEPYRAIVPIAVRGRERLNGTSRTSALAVS